MRLSNCGGLLLVELDGTATEVETLMRQVSDICARSGAWEIRLAHSEAERMVVWKGRKAAFAAMGRISPNYIVQDGVVPRTALPQIMNEIARLSRESGCGSLTSSTRAMEICIPWCSTIAALRARNSSPSRSPRHPALCIKAGGSITGEHGVGEEKKMFMGRCSPNPTSTPCNWFVAPSIPNTSPTPARCFRGFACAPKKPARIHLIRWSWPEWRSSSDGGNFKSYAANSVA